MTEAEAIAESNLWWRQAHIAECLAIMQRWGISIEELVEYDKLKEHDETTG